VPKNSVHISASVQKSAKIMFKSIKPPKNLNWPIKTRKIQIVFGLFKIWKKSKRVEKASNDKNLASKKPKLRQDWRPTVKRFAFIWLHFFSECGNYINSWKEKSKRLKREAHSRKTSIRGLLIHTRLRLIGFVVARDSRLCLRSKKSNIFTVK